MSSIGAIARAHRAAGRRRIAAEVWDAGAEAKAIRDAAAADARTMLEAAHADAGRLRAEAAARGYEEGLAASSETLARAAAERERLLATAERDLIDLAFEIASRILVRAAERDPEAAVEVATRALDAARSRSDVTLRVHPEDVPALREAEPRLLERMSRARRIALVEDAAVGRGGAVVETEAVSIDARLTTQLDGLRRALESAAS